MLAVPSVVGNAFTLIKACPHHGTTAGMRGVIVSYTQNPAKANRMEAEVDFYEAAEAAAAAEAGSLLKKMEADPAGLDADELAALVAARSKAAVKKIGLPHASLARIHPDWRALSPVRARVFRVHTQVVAPRRIRPGL